MVTAPRFIELTLAHGPNEAPQSIFLNVNYIITFYRVPSRGTYPANAATELHYSLTNGNSIVYLAQTPTQVKAILEAQS